MCISLFFLAGNDLQRKGNNKIDRNIQKEQRKKKRGGYVKICDLRYTWWGMPQDRSSTRPESESGTALLDSVAARAMMLTPLGEVMERFHCSEMVAWKKLRECAGQVLADAAAESGRQGGGMVSMWELMTEKGGKVSNPAANAHTVSVSTGLSILDNALLGGLRPPFLVEFRNPSPSLPSFCAQSEENPNRILVAHMVKNVLQKDPTALVWWFSPSPSDGSVAHLFSLLGTAGGGGKWQKRLFFVSLDTAEALLQCSSQLKSMFCSFNEVKTPHPAIRPSLVVVDGVSLLLERSFGDCPRSLERLSFLSSLVRLWKSAAIECQLVVIFLSTAAREGGPLRSSSVSGAMGGAVQRQGDELGREFSHSMNVRFALHPGWFMEDNQWFYQIRILKSPVCGNVEAQFRIRSCKAHCAIEEVPNAEVRGRATDPCSDIPNAPLVSRKRHRAWVPYENLSALDPLDYLIPSR